MATPDVPPKNTFWGVPTKAQPTKQEEGSRQEQKRHLIRALEREVTRNTSALHISDTFIPSSKDKDIHLCLKTGPLAPQLPESCGSCRHCQAALIPMSTAPSQGKDRSGGLATLLVESVSRNSLSSAARLCGPWQCSHLLTEALYGTHG